MLLQFSVENFLSFREPQVLSMLAAEGIDHPPHMVMEGPDGKKVLRCAAIYGANASGKSNLVKALEFGTSLALDGEQPGEPLRVSPFRLDSDCAHQPARFEWQLAASSTRYSYGYEVDSRAVLSEWLFKTCAGKEECVFERHMQRITLGPVLMTEPKRTSFLEFVAEGTRVNQPFLAEARLRNVAELDLVALLVERTRCVRPQMPVGSIFDLMRGEATFRTFLATLLQAAGSGVKDIRIEPGTELDWDLMVGTFERAQQAELSGFRQKGSGPLMALATFRAGSRGDEVRFNVLEESDGTQRLVNLAPMLFEIERGRPDLVYAIDELERSLHPLLTRAFLERFLASSSKSQLLFTTHDTNLLDLNLLSRDAIWFTEKDPVGATVLYSLAEYKEDQISQLGPQLERGYLQGRFGAIPFLGDASRLGWKKTVE